MPFNVKSVTLVPLMRCSDLPEILSVLEKIIESPSSNSIPLSAKAEIIFAEQQSKTASTLRDSLPALINSLSALAPRTKVKASIIILLPLPVSPISTLKPLPNSIVEFSIKAKFLIDNEFIILYLHFYLTNNIT